MDSEVNKLEGELSEAKTKLEQESQKEKLLLEKQNKLQNELQSLKNEGIKAKDSYEKLIKQLQADLKKSENEKSTEIGKLRATFALIEENNVEINAKYESLKRNQEVWFSVINEYQFKSEKMRIMCIIQISDFGCDLIIILHILYCIC